MSANLISFSIWTSSRSSVQPSLSHNVSTPVSMSPSTAQSPGLLPQPPTSSRFSNSRGVRCFGASASPTYSKQ